jgi:hypothetical protein
MKYKIVEIQPSLNDEWRVTVREIPGDRVKCNTEPCGMGWYYYDGDSMSDQEAFDKLKSHMLKEHNEKIDQLQKSADKLYKCMPPKGGGHV